MIHSIHDSTIEKQEMPPILSILREGGFWEYQRLPASVQKASILIFESLDEPDRAAHRDSWMMIRRPICSKTFMLTA